MKIYDNGIYRELTAEEIAAIQTEAEKAEAEYWRNISYDEAVATEVRKKYSQDAVEAILNNFLADPTNELFKAEFFALQDYRAECKAYVKAMKAKYAQGGNV